ncbi:hypothetical protein [Palleronia caenipelagi]|uniref:Lipoprotein n=1 Tax=Palleronia caenipelagi TaxID=2489174 RepID=A0A547PRF8_9RHOB|nr:hypothetical protein [Palleronia caenipelagi]TRD16604.1 hypothetical protein FEV53_13950 [Palleronia caenipelagi]
MKSSALGLSAVLLTATLLAGCATTPEDTNTVYAAEPGYAPDDPCKGVVPEMCPRPGIDYVQ